MAAAGQIVSAGADQLDQVARGVAAGIEAARLRLDGVASEAGGAWARVWPPGGDRLSFLRYLTRDPAQAIAVDSPRGYSLTLDRTVTAPTATLGVSFDRPTPYRSRWLYLTPGDTLTVPGGFERFWIFNADAMYAVQDPATNPPTVNFPLGFCGFLVGTRRRAGAPVQHAVRAPAHIVQAWITSGAGPYFVRGGCTLFRLTALLLDALNRALNAPLIINVNLSAYPDHLPADAVNGSYSTALIEGMSMDDRRQLANVPDQTLYLSAPNGGAAFAHFEFTQPLGLFTGVALPGGGTAGLFILSAIR